MQMVAVRKENSKKLKANKPSGKNKACPWTNNNNKETRKKNTKNWFSIMFSLKSIDKWLKKKKQNYTHGSKKQNDCECFCVPYLKNETSTSLIFVSNSSDLYSKNKNKSMTKFIPTKKRKMCILLLISAVLHTHNGWKQKQNKITLNYVWCTISSRFFNGLTKY